MLAKFNNYIVNNKKNIIIYIISAILAIISIIISKNFIQPKIFEMAIVYQKISYKMLNLFFVGVVFLCYCFIINFVSKLFTKDSFYIKWLFHFTICICILGVFLILMWPGHWVWDELNIFQSTIKANVDTWQSYITIIYYSLCIMIFPSPIIIMIIQVLIIAFIISYIITKIYNICKNRYVIACIYLLMFTPAIIINNLYPLRLTLYAYILLLFFTILIIDKLENKKLNLLKIFKIYLLIIIILLWRSEGLIFAILSPILIYFTYRKKGINLLKTLIIFLLNILIIFGYNSMLNILTEVPNNTNTIYELTIYINPLSMMLQNDLKGNNIDNDLKNLDKVMDINILKSNPSYKEIPAYWNNSNLIRNNFEEHLSEFKKSYIRLVINNFDCFLKARMKTFLATSCMYEGNNGNMDSVVLSYCIDNGSSKEITNNFINNYKYMNPISKTVKYKVESFLLGNSIQNNKLKFTFILIFWDLIPIVFIIFIFTILSLIKKEWQFLIMYMSLLGMLGIIFVTAPANYFMYYFPIYLTTLIISLIFISIILKSNTNLSKKG